MCNAPPQRKLHLPLLEKGPAASQPRRTQARARARRLLQRLFVPKPCFCSCTPNHVINSRGSPPLHNTPKAPQEVSGACGPGPRACLTEKLHKKSLSVEAHAGFAPEIPSPWQRCRTKLLVVEVPPPPSTVPFFQGCSVTT